MARNLIVNAFNKTFDNFLNDLIAVFPEDPDFRMYKNAVNVLKNVNERKSFSLFMQHSPRYRPYILNRDDAFFLDQSYDELAEGNNISELVSKLKGLWSQLSQENRNTVWKYMETFITLQDKYAAIKDA
jgi:hypothetical protein